MRVGVNYHWSEVQLKLLSILYKYGAIVINNSLISIKAIKII